MNLGARIERDAREELYISLLGKSQTFHHRQLTGDLMSRATGDVQTLYYMCTPGARLIMEALLNAVVPLVAIGLMRVDLLLIPLMFLAVFAVALRHYNKQLSSPASEMRRQMGALNAHLTEAISGIEVVKAYAQEAQEQQRFLNNARQYRDTFIRDGRIRARYLPIWFYGVAFSLAFAHALWLLMQGTFSVGQVIAYMGLITQLRFITFISMFSFALIQYGLAGAERILALLTKETDLDENIAGAAQPIRGAISFEHVSFDYGTTPVLNDVSFQVLPGETVAIVGQTGAGKTTLTRLVNRTYDPSSGHILIDGIDLRDWSLDSLRSQIGMIEQDIFLFSRTIAENIALGAGGSVTRAEIEEVAGAAQAHDFIMSLVDGYDTTVGERGVVLSGGQRQRVAIARAFLANPHILILDNSTSAIDSLTEDEIQQAICRIAQGRTTLLITHRLSQICWADRILVLQQGTLVAQGTHDELLLQSPDYRRIFASLEMEQVEADELYVF